MKYFLLITFFILGFFITPIKYKKIENRKPANFYNLSNCKNLISSFFKKEKNKLSDSLIEHKTKYYLNLLENDFIKSEKFGDTTEDFIGFLEALKLRYGLEDQTLKLQKFSKTNIANIRSIITKISKNKKSFFSTDFELIESLFYHMYGKQLRFRDFLNYNETKESILKRTLMLNIANHGLSYIFPELKKETKFYTKFHQFIKSRTGRFLGTMLFNTPVIYGGVYPLFVPKLGLVKLSDEMMSELLLNGFGKENSKVFFESISMSLKNKFSLNLNNRARYEFIRSYYLKGATIFTIAFLSYNFYQDRQFYLESNESVDKLLTISDVIDELEANSLDITQENNIESFACGELRACIEAYDSKFKNLENLKESTFYNDCKIEFAPLLNCL